jgi:hypothetical protein
MRYEEQLDRGRPRSTPSVHALLRYPGDVGIESAPRLPLVDEQGREVLTYLPGEVLRRASPEVATDRTLV